MNKGTLRFLSNQLEKEKKYWLQKLSTVNLRTSLPQDVLNEKTLNDADGKGQVSFSLSPALAKQLTLISNNNEYLGYTMLTAALKLCVYKYTGQSDIVFGTAVYKNDQTDNLLNKVLVLRDQINNEDTIKDFIHQVRTTLKDAYEHQKFPYEILLELLNGEGNYDEIRLFNISVLFDGINDKENISHIDNDLILYFSLGDGEVKGHLEYNAALFNAASMEYFVRRYELILQKMINNPDKKIQGIEMLFEGEKDQLLTEFNDTGDNKPVEKTIGELFEECVKKSPDSIAVVYNDEQLSYRELNIRANKIANYLHEAGCGAETPIAICLDRSIEIIVSLFGVIKAGCTYIPIDPVYPKERIEFILGDSKAAILITQEHLIESLFHTHAKLLCIDKEWNEIEKCRSTNPSRKSTIENAFNIIYTSGSTGRPKGAVITQLSVLNLLAALDKAHYSLLPDRSLRLSLNGPVAFDVSVKQIIQLVKGHTLYIIAQDIRIDHEAFLAYLRKVQLDVIETTPSQLKWLLEAGLLTEQDETQKIILVGGEPIDFSTWKKLSGLAHFEFFNVYGPTECTVNTTIARISNHPAPTIGRPIQNVYVYILDTDSKPAPILVPGELYIGGLGLGRGYSNRADLTAERFLPNPISGNPGSRLYRTGDLTRYLSDGSIEFLGRVDRQVKIRGYRIEPAEIEQCLSNHSAVKESAVIVKENGSNQRLTAYVVPKTEYAPTIEGYSRYVLPNNLAVTYLNKDETDLLYSEIFEVHAYTKYGIKIQDGDCIFDVGANIGLFTLFSHLSANNIKVFAFEPNPAAYNLLRLNISLYNVTAELIACGLSDRKKSATFTYYPKISYLSGLYADADKDKDVALSFLRRKEQIRAEGELRLTDDKPLLNMLLDERFRSCELEVSLQTISDIIREKNINRINLLKINVEKSEEDVLTGIADEDWEKIDQIVMELHDLNGRLDRVSAVISAHGFEMNIERDWSLDQEKNDNYYIYASRKNIEVRGGERSNGSSLNAEILTSTSLRKYLRERLPYYMMPSDIVIMERFPMSPNGKLDQNALPTIDNDYREFSSNLTPLRNPIEDVLIQIWSAILGTNEFDVNDNFFELGGHSLTATQIISRIKNTFGVEIPLRIMFETPTIRALAVAVESAGRINSGASIPPIMQVPHDKPLPLSFAQQRLWFLDKLMPGTASYNAPIAYRINGLLNVKALEKSINEIISRHEILRTKIEILQDEPVQVILPSRKINLKVEDLTEYPIEIREQKVNKLLNEEGRATFKLNKTPNIRVRIFRIAEKEHVLIMTMHHIVGDGWSRGLFIKELSYFYKVFAEGLSHDLPRLSIQYADFALWQRQYLQGEVLTKQLAYWNDRLNDAPKILNLPTDRSRPTMIGSRGAIERFKMDSPVTRGLKAIAYQQKSTMFMVLLTAYAVLLSRYSNTNDLIIGTPIANRNIKEIETLIGFFSNTLLLRVNLSDNPTFIEALRRVREEALGAYMHQDLPFEKLVEEMQPERDLSRHPLCQVVFTLQNAPEKPMSLYGLHVQPINVDTNTSKFDLVLNIYETDDAMPGSIEYNIDMFDAQTIKSLIGRFEILLNSILENPNQAIRQLPIISKEEDSAIENKRGEGRLQYPKDSCITQLIDKQALNIPEATALEYQGNDTSYGELKKMSDGIARYLKSIGIDSGSKVGVCMGNSPELIISILGTLKSGAAYIPLELDHPSERLKQMLDDADVEVVLTERGSLEKLSDVNLKKICIDTKWEEFKRFGGGGSVEPELNPEDDAYVIYTSGSTGKPKGVRISHRALLNYVWWASKEYFKEGDEAIALHTSPAFDLTITSIFVPLIIGKRVIIYRKKGRESSILEVMTENKVDVLKLTPSHLSLLKDSDNRNSRIRRLIVGGESLETNLARQIHDSFGGKIEIFNEYGPTEATVGCMIYRYNVNHDTRSTVPIGCAAANSEIYLLDEELREVGSGMVGEIYIGGEGLATGYQGGAELTAERFKNNPYKSGNLIYKTGDLARRLWNGDLEYLGRKDEQIKYHGYRVELNELRAAVNTHENIRDSVVKLKKDSRGKDILMCWYVSRQEIDAGELREYLRQRIIEETIPGLFMRIPKLPLTLNGKVNYDALPGVDEAREQLKSVIQVKLAENERVIATVWSEVLGISIDKIGPHDNFFTLGGHSLLASMLAIKLQQALNIETPLRIFFEYPTVVGLAGAVSALSDQRKDTKEKVLVPVVRDEFLPLTFAQQRLWFLHQLIPGTALYNVPIAYRISGNLDTRLLENSIKAVIRRHEILRTRIKEVDGQPFQVIDNSIEFQLIAEDLRKELNNDLDQGDKRLKQILRDNAKLPFDLSCGPMLRAYLYQLNDQEFILLFVIHHIVCDEQSVEIFLREITEHYKSFEEGKEVDLLELKIQYVDYSVQQKKLFEDNKMESQLNYWRKQLAGVSTILDLPTDYSRSLVPGSAGTFKWLNIKSSLSAALKDIAQQENATLFISLLTLYGLLLHRISHQDVLLIGIPIAHRNSKETESLIGFFVNTLVIKIECSRNLSFRTLLRQVRETFLDALANQDLPFEKLVEELHPDRSLSSMPLFQTFFSFQSMPMKELKTNQQMWSPIRVDTDTSKFELMLNLFETDGDLIGGFEYNTDLFSSTTITQLSDRLVVLLEGIIQSPDKSIRELPIINESEHRQLLLEWNQTDNDFAGNNCIHQRFEKQVKETPDAIALIFGEQMMSYKELNMRANQLAHYLRASGIEPEKCIGLCFERSVEMVIAMLGILKAGGAYLPLDPCMPANRLSFMLEDASCDLVVTTSKLQEKLLLQRQYVVCIDSILDQITYSETENTEINIGGENLAYVIYTSGSTGVPKGVTVTHKAVLRLVINTNYIDINSNDVFLQFAPITFDAATFEIWGSLLNGSCLVIMSPELPTFTKLGESLCTNQVTILWLTAGLFHQIVENEINSLTKLRYLLAGGDVLSVAHVGRMLDTMKRGQYLINGYGPTENTTFTCCYQMTGEYEPGASVLIGHPINNTSVYMLDDEFAVVPKGVKGEIFIGGEGVARGYINCSDKTAECFVPHPYSLTCGERLYRSGDIGRQKHDGALEFIGRVDNQVKIRGFRIEPGEIELVLEKHVKINQAVVSLYIDDSSDKRLIAYYTGEELKSDELRSHLSLNLPDYMIPSAFIHTDSFSLTVNGKVDRNALPVSEFKDSFVIDISSEVKTPIEEILIGLWTDILKLDFIGVNENFFELGGHSLLAMQALSRIRSVFGLELPLRVIFEYPTVRSLSRTITDLRKTQGGGTKTLIECADPDESYPLSFSQQRLWFLDQLNPNSPNYNVPVCWRLKGDLDVKLLEKCINEIIKRHDILRTTFSLVEGRGRQFIHKSCKVNLDTINLIDLSDEIREQVLTSTIHMEARIPFDLHQEPLLRSKLFQFTDKESILLILLHHIVCDAASIDIFIKELTEYYNAHIDNRSPSLPELPIQYSDYAVHQTKWLAGEEFERQLQYWKGKMAGAPTVLSLRGDHPRPEVYTSNGSVHYFNIDEETTSIIRNISGRQGSTLFMTTLASFCVWLYKLTGQKELLVGTPILNRNCLEVENLFGFFTNTLIIRIDLNENSSFRELVAQVRKTALEAYDNQDLPFEKLVEELQIKRDLSRPPLAQVSFGLQNSIAKSPELTGLSITHWEIDMKTSKYDIAMGLAVNNSGLSGVIQYNTDIFNGDTIQRMASDYALLLDQITREPDLPIQNWFSAIEETTEDKNITLSHPKLSKDDKNTLGSVISTSVTNIEEIIVSLWKDALNNDNFGLNDNFFDLGGHSLLLPEILVKLRDTISPTLTMIDLFRYPTISSLAEYLAQQGRL